VTYDLPAFPRTVLQIDESSRDKLSQSSRRVQHLVAQYNVCGRRSRDAKAFMNDDAVYLCILREHQLASLQLESLPFVLSES
jgi:hypothetical protein